MEGIPAGRPPSISASGAVSGPAARSVGAAAATPAAAAAAGHSAVTALRLYSDTYSNFVGFMKFVLPAVAFLLVTLVMLWPQIKQTKKDVTRSIMSSLSVEDIENLQIVRPRYTGVDAGDRPFMLTADLARQETAKADLVTLTAPKADITLEDGAWLAMTAKAGAYYQKAKILHLTGEVSLFHDDGYTVQTGEARIDFNTGNAEGDLPVIGEGPLGTLRSEGFRVYDKGARMMFIGRTRLVIYIDDEGLKRFMPGGGAPTGGKSGR